MPKNHPYHSDESFVQGQVQSFDGELCDVWVPLFDPIGHHSCAHLAADDGYRNIEPALIAQHLLIARDLGRLRYRDAAKSLAQFIGEVDEVFRLEKRPIGQRHLAVDHW